MKIETLKLYSRIARILKDYNPDVIDGDISWVVKNEVGKIFMIQIGGEVNYSLHIFEFTNDVSNDKTQFIENSKILKIIDYAYHKNYYVTRAIC